MTTAAEYATALSQLQAARSARISAAELARTHDAEVDEAAYQAEVDAANEEYAQAAGQLPAPDAE